MTTYTMASTEYFSNPYPPPRWYKFKGDGLPLVLLQIIEGAGLSKVDPVRRTAVKYLPPRGGTPGEYDDFQDLVEDLATGGTFVFTMVCDASNNITEFTWRRYTGTRQLSGPELLLVEATEKLDGMDTYVRQAVPPDLGEQIGEIRSLLQTVVDRNQVKSGFPKAITEAEAEDLRKSG